MNNPDLVKYRLGRAKSDLKLAIQRFEEYDLETAANRAYYSIFHSMRTVLALESKDFKKHSAVISYFNKHYIKTKIFPSNLYKLISEAQEVREENDYMDFFEPDYEETKKQVESAELIYGLVEEYIKNKEHEHE